MPPPRVRSVEVLSDLSDLDPERYNADVAVRLEDGTSSSFVVSTPNEPARWLDADKVDFSHGAPLLFVRRFETAAVREAVEAMAAEMSGYWLRYYRCPPDPGRRERGRAPAAKLRVARAELARVEPPGEPSRASGVVEAFLEDGRQFSLLAATPAWFEEAFERLGLRYYFGPLVLFVRRLEPVVCRRAAESMAQAGDRWLCLYDTPHRTLNEVLAGFRSRHP